MRRRAALALVAAALAALVWGARPDRPLAASFRVMARFWRADARTRLYNTVLFAEDRALGRALLVADEKLPPRADALVCVARPDEETRRKAAFVLAPRRVVLAAGCDEPAVRALP